MTKPTALGPQTAKKVERFFGREHRQGTQVHRPMDVRDLPAGFQGLKVVQTPSSNGIPGISGSTAGSELCFIVLMEDGQLTRTNETIRVYNIHETALGRFGQQLVLVDKHQDGALAINSTCEEDATGNPNQIPVQNTNQG